MFFSANCGLELHPNKIYFQHYLKGLPFLGVTIKPYRILSGRRIKGNFYGMLLRNYKSIGKSSVFDKSKLLESLNVGHLAFCKGATTDLAKANVGTQIAKDAATEKAFVCSFNSYLGFLLRCNSYCFCFRTINKIFGQNGIRKETSEG